MLEGGRGLVEQPQRGLGREVAPPQHAATGRAATRRRRSPRRAGARRSAGGGCRPRAVAVERTPRERAKPAKERRVRSSPRKRPTAPRSSSTRDARPEQAEASARSARSVSPTKATACRRSSAVAGRRSETGDVGEDVERRGSRATPWVSCGSSVPSERRRAAAPRCPKGPSAMRATEPGLPAPVDEDRAGAACRPRRTMPTARPALGAERRAARARTGRRGRPARSARWPRRTGGRSRRAPPRPRPGNSA